MSALKAPFPYYGGKSRFADEVWSRLGDPTVYVEPFAGSLAVLLRRDAPGQREIVCDLNGFIPNFWRALREDPEAVAYWADYPTFHHDLTARHRWLVEWGRENAERLSADADWYDAKAAGWWVWGISSWIGGKWCDDRGDVTNSAPALQAAPGGRGVSAQRLAILKVSDAIPKVADRVGGQGVQTQRRQLPGVVGTGERLSDWFHALAQRLSRVVVLNRDWSSGLTPTLLMHTAQSPKPPVGIFLDPPYKQANRVAVGFYRNDLSDDVAVASYEWAVEHGANPQYRIAYCCHEGDFPLPDDWTVGKGLGFKGIKKPKRRGNRDIIMYSPGCLTPEREKQSAPGEQLILNA